MKYSLLAILLLGMGTLHADDAPNWYTEPRPDAVIDLAEPLPDEVVVVINDNALGGNHAGLFAGGQLIDPAGSYVGMRGRDKHWPGPTLADYALPDGRRPEDSFLPFSFATRRFRRYPTAYPRRRLDTAAVLRVGGAEPAGRHRPFDGVAQTGFTTPAALGRLLDRLTQGADAVGECQKLDASRADFSAKRFIP